ncbi:MAG: hypothetical protein AAFN42_12935 [Cyanobacteria bacterium J06554_1]
MAIGERADSPDAIGQLMNAECSRWLLFAIAKQSNQAHRAPKIIGPIF